MKDQWSFKKFLIDTIGLYGTVPDSGSYTAELTCSFKIANEAFELPVIAIKRIVLKQLEHERFKLNAYIDKAMEEITDY